MIAQGLLGGLRLGRARRGARAAAAIVRGGRALRRRRALLAIVAVAAILTGAWLWVRDSSLVAVKRVTVTGESGPDAAQIRAALMSAARNMTTLHVRMAALRTAVAPYPIVRGVQVSTQFPHGMRIRVVEQVPVGAVVVGGRTVAVAGDGTLLRDLVIGVALPTVPLRVPPGGSRVSDPEGRSEVALLAAAPYRLLASIAQVTTISSRGLVAQLRSGPSIYFGDANRLAAKWIAASEVLADAGSTGASYIDVTDPDRPAAGSGSDGASAASTSAGALTTSTSSSAAGAAPTAGAGGAGTTPNTAGGG